MYSYAALDVHSLEIKTPRYDYLAETDKCIQSEL